MVLVRWCTHADGWSAQGVSYFIPRSGDLTEPSVINNWPGLLGRIDRVPTIIACAYTESMWGFEITPAQRVCKRTIIDEKFKLLLDTDVLDEFNTPTELITMDVVRKCYKLFLSKLYKWTSVELAANTGRPLQGMTVEYLFSVPATWKEGTASDYLNMIKESGFGSVDGHTARIGLNEAEATVMYTAFSNSRGEIVRYKVGVLRLRMNKNDNICHEAWR